jgi:serine protease Do
MTKDEVNKLISGIDQNVTVNGGNNYNVTINSTESKNLLAASKALLSAVSINCTFNVTVNTIFGTPTTQEKQTAGAGVIYQLNKDKGDAYIITNYHVVYLNGANTKDSISDNIKVYLYGQEYEQYAIYADYIGGSQNYDIAVLKVKNSNVLKASNAVAAEFADSNDVCVLDTAIAIGNPAAIGISATVGSINVDSENLTMTSIDGTGRVTLRVMRIDTAINGGNSGGGLFNDTGKLIGIVNAKISDSSIDNIGYAIPSNVAKNVADNIIYYDSQDPENDCVYRILIGVTVGIASARTEYDTETGKVHKIEDVKIESVTVGGISDGKLAAGDIVRSVVIDGVTYDIVRTFNVIDVMLNARVTSAVTFNVERNGKTVSVDFDLSGAVPVEY